MEARNGERGGGGGGKGRASHTEPDGGDGGLGRLLLGHLLDLLAGLAHLGLLLLGELEVRPSLLGGLRLCAGSVLVVVVERRKARAEG